MPGRDGEELPFGITTRSRRRRKAKATVDIVQKENLPDNDSSIVTTQLSQEAEKKPSSTTAKPRKTKVTVNRTKKGQKKKTPPTLTKYVWIYACMESHDEVRGRFRMSLDKLPIKDLKVWKDDPYTSQALIDASLSLSQSNNKEASSVLPIHDEDSYKDILSICRKVIKSATETRAKDVETSIHSLFVALHGLRALSVVSTSEDTTRAEDIMRLLYHLITTASTAHKDLVDQQTQGKGKRRKKVDSTIMLAEEICLRGYETLCYVLLDYSLVFEESNQIVEFTFPKDDKDRQIPWLSMFPVPIIAQRKGSNKTKTQSTMKLSQIYSIGAQATLAVARTFIDASSPITSFFQETEDASSSLTALPSLRAKAVDMLRIITFSWAAFMSMHVPDKEETTTKEIASICQQSHRVLWDLASRASTGQNEPQPEEACGMETALEIRKHALLILLGYCEAPSNTTMDSCLNFQSQAGRMLTTKYFDNVCTMTWKAPASSGAKGKDTTVQQPALHDFHVSVGSVLDKIADLLSMQESFPYTEYCAHRALSIGSSVSSKHTPTSACCSNENSSCIFMGLPFPFSHQCPFNSEDVFGADRKDLLNSVTLCAFFLSLQLRNELQQMLRRIQGQDEKPNQSNHDCAHRSHAAAFFRVFEDVFLVDPQAIPFDDKLRCFKLLSLVSLQSTVYQVSTVSCHDFLPSEAATLGLCTDFLARCFGPFALSILSCGRSLEEKRVAHLCDIVVESYGRPAIVWDNLSVAEDDHSLQDYLERSNSAISALKDILGSPNTTKHLIQRVVIDKAAKIFASIGKRRASRVNKALSVLPMLHSLSLFIKSASIANTARESSHGSENHLFARWSFVAGVFHSLKWRDAALLGSAVALNCFFASTGSGDSCSWVDVVRDLASKTHGILPVDYKKTRLPDNVRVLIRRITRSSHGRGVTQHVDIVTPKQPLHMDDAIRILSCLNSNSMESPDDSVVSAFQGMVGCQFSLVSVLQALFGASGPGINTPLASDANVKVRLIASLLGPLGQTIQRNTSTESATSGGEQEDYEGLVKLLMEWTNSIPAVECDRDQNKGEIAATAIRATAYTAAACNLLSETEVYEHLLLGTGDKNTAIMDPCSASLLSFAANFATQAREILAQQSNADDSSRDLFYSALRSSILVFVETLKSFLGDSHSPIHGESLVAHFDMETIRSLGSLQETQILSTELARFCLLRTLCRVRDRLAFQGDKLSAAQVALWLQSLSSSTGYDVDHQWTSTRLSQVLISADLAEVAAQNEMHAVGEEEDFLGGLQTVADESELCNQLVQIEAHIGSVRFKLHHSNDAIDLESINEELNALLRHLESIQEESDDAGLTSLTMWVKSSALLSLSEVAEIAGNVSCALSGTRQCFQAYQETISSAKIAFSSTLDEITTEQPFLHNILPTLIVGSMERSNECLHRISTLNAIIGDYRKSEVYALCAMKNSGTHGMFEQLKPNTPLPELLALLREVSPGNRNELTCRRGFLWSRASATACDIVLKEFQDVASASASFPFLALTSASPSSASLCDKLDQIGDIFVVGNLFHNIQISPARAAAVTKYERALAVYEAVTSDQWFQRLSEAARVVNPPTSGRPLLMSVLYQTKLGEIRRMLEDLEEMEPGAQEDATAACLDLSQAIYAPKECRAWALYYLGLIALHTARETNALASLWAGCSNDPPMSCPNPPDASESLRRARGHFNDALMLLGPASQMLTRMVLRSLALVTGPERQGKVSANSASILINTSIGCTARQVLGQLSKDSTVETNDENTTSSDLLEALDVGFSQPLTRENHVNSFLDALAQLAPPGWRFVTSTICPTGEVLTSSICASRNGQDLLATTVCHFPENKSGGAHFLYSNQTYDAMMKPFDSVILRSQQHLRDSPASSGDAQADVSTRREWWKERNRFDDELQHLLSHVEGEYFDSRPARLALFGNDDGPGVLDESFDSSSSSDSSLCGDLTSKFEAVSLNLFADSSNTPAAKGRQGRSDAPPTTGRKSKRLDTSNISLDNQECQPSYCDQDMGQHTSEATTCTLLFLDENLSRFPFEGLPSFANRSVCRFLSLPFALASLHDHCRPPVIDPAKASYVVDPEANLNATQERLGQFLNHRHRWSWEGVSGEVPSAEFMKENLAKENGLLLYCGHGSGQTCFSRSQVEELMKQKWSSDEDGAPCQSSVILMGCSSGRLESVNRKGSDELTNHAIFYEPEGIALSYLLAGAPCVVGNLWDVTDHDIDRYCLDLLERLARPDNNGKGVSIAGAVAQARSACKMTYINGCAPVCYGLPVEVLQSYSR